MQCTTQREKKGSGYRAVWDTGHKYTGKGDFNDTTSLVRVIPQEDLNCGFLLVQDEQRDEEHVATGGRK